jgi:hypothetical protein
MACGPLGWIFTRPPRQLCQARENFVQMATQLKNMGHAALTRNGIALKHRAFTSANTRLRLAHRPGLVLINQQILEVALRQLDALARESN